MPEKDRVRSSRKEARRRVPAALLREATAGAAEKAETAPDEDALREVFRKAATEHRNNIAVLQLLPPIELDEGSKRNERKEGIERKKGCPAVSFVPGWILLCSNQFTN
mmetsp:Transcript_7335/g.17722  ORF Transcript_7335/g.17722 Transcript_7335/m.17722 type:complete len:108 (+) Transcript_7335:1399-1722(+)